MKFERYFRTWKNFAIDKLIEIVSNSVGRISKLILTEKMSTLKFMIKQIAETRAEEMKIISKPVKRKF
jgi:hypothetical protein